MSNTYSNIRNRQDVELPATPHTPTKDSKDDVIFLSGIGVPVPQIAMLAKLPVERLREHYTHEIDLGPAEANRQICEILFNLASSGRHPSVTMFWAKARCGFSTSGGAASQRLFPEGPPRVVLYEGTEKWEL